MSKNNDDIQGVPGADATPPDASADPLPEASAEPSGVARGSGGSSDEHKEKLHKSFNNRISYLCRLVAFVLAVVTFATTILGRNDMKFVVLGLSLSIALLAIAGLQNHTRPKR